MIRYHSQYVYIYILSVLIIHFNRIAVHHLCLFFCYPCVMDDKNSFEYISNPFRKQSDVSKSDEADSDAELDKLLLDVYSDKYGILSEPKFKKINEFSIYGIFMDECWFLSFLLLICKLALHDSCDDPEALYDGSLFREFHDTLSNLTDVSHLKDYELLTFIKDRKNYMSSGMFLSLWKIRDSIVISRQLYWQ